MSGRLRSALARVLPTRAEVWTYGVGSLFPFALLAAARVALAYTGDEAPTLTDLWRIQLGDWEFWTAWGWLWWLGQRLILRRRAARLVAAIFHALGAFVCLYSALDLAYYQTTGSRPDWEMLAYGFGDLSRVWPVVSSELTPGRWAALAGVIAFCFAPWFRRGVEGPGGWRAVVWLLALLPVIQMELDGRKKPAAALKSLQQSAFDVLMWDGIERWGEVVIPADPADLVPLEVRPREGARHPNVVLVFLESVGASATTPYAPTLATTPVLARLASEGVLVENMTAVVPHTSKALVTTICGDWPYLRADVREARPGGLPGPCLPQLLAEAGYRSAFFQPARGDFEDRAALVHEMGYGTFRPKHLVEAPGFEPTNYFGIDDRAMIEPGLAWSTAEPGRPFFATYLTLASHHDYKLPTSWPQHVWPDLVGRRAEYLAAVNFVDAFLGDLIEAYRAAGLLDDTVFVVVGDHGEGFGEHGRSQHDLVIYEEGLRVPAVVWGPGVLDRAGVVAEGARQQIDVLPTILGLAGLEVSGGATRGTDLLTDPPADRALYHSCWRAHRCLARRVGDDKLVDLFRDGGLRRFDLAADPDERTDLAAGDASLAPLREDLRAWRGRVLGRYEALFARWRSSVQVPDTSPPIATWGERVSLLSCLPETTEALPGETVWVDCRWRAEAPLDEAIRVTTTFRAGAVTATATWVPGNGELPAWEWAPGHAIADTVRVDVPADAPPGPATIEVGWASYTGSPLSLPGGATERQAATITVLPRPERVVGPGVVASGG